MEIVYSLTAGRTHLAVRRAYPRPPKLNKLSYRGVRWARRDQRPEEIRFLPAGTPAGSDIQGADPFRLRLIAGGRWFEKDDYPAVLYSTSSDFHPVHALTGGLHPPTCDRQSVTRSPRSHLRIPCYLEHVEFLEFVIVAHYAHTTGALYPNEISEKTGGEGGSQSDWIDWSDSPDRLTPHLEHLHQDEHLRSLQINLELFWNGVCHGLDESLPGQSAMVPDPQLDLVLFPGVNGESSSYAR